MKRMIDNKDYDVLKKDVKDVSDVVEAHATDYIITDVVVTDEQVDGFIIKDVKNEITYNIELGGGGKQLYQHNFNFSDTGFVGCLSFINDNPNAMTSSQIASYLTAKGFTSDTKGIAVSCVYSYNGSRGVMVRAYAEGSSVKLYGRNVSNDTDITMIMQYGSDTVIPL